MLLTGLTVVEEISVCDKGITGVHDDRRADGKIPVNGRQEYFFLDQSN